MRTRLKIIPVLAGVALAGTLALPAAASARSYPVAPHRHLPGMPVARVYPATPASLRAAGLLPPVGTRPGVASEYVNWFNTAYTSQCIRDPSGGGGGTDVLNSGCDDSNAEDWVWAVSYDCPGGTVTSTCPGGPISADLNGAQLITWRNLALGFANGCFHTSDTTSWTAIMISTCGDDATTYAVGRIFGSGYYTFASVKADTEYGCLYYLDNDGRSNSSLFADEGQGAKCANVYVYQSQQWNLINS